MNAISPGWMIGSATRATGAPAYPPAVLLKLILFGYSRGIVSSREIERACLQNVVFIALSGERAPHFTTLTAFVRTLGEEIANIFTQVQGLSGRGNIGSDSEVSPQIPSAG
ncbi:MAG TPA: transposase [Burkholderiales bacterium]|nr:transposase [Burkholderiales bacterium]